MRARNIKVGVVKRRWRGDHQTPDDACFDQPLDHAGPGTGFAHDISLFHRRIVTQKRHHPLARRCHAKAAFAIAFPFCRIGKGKSENRLGRLQRVGNTHRHAQHRPLRRHGIGRHPIDELSRHIGHRRCLQNAINFAQLGRIDVAPGLTPDDAALGLTAQWNFDKVAGLNAQTLGDKIIIRARQGQRRKNTDRFARYLPGRNLKGRIITKQISRYGLCGAHIL